jgi:hypothetical protein
VHGVQIAGLGLASEGRQRELRLGWPAAGAPKQCTTVSLEPIAGAKPAHTARHHDLTPNVCHKVAPRSVQLHGCLQAQMAPPYARTLHRLHEAPVSRHPVQVPLAVHHHPRLPLLQVVLLVQTAQNQQLAQLVELVVAFESHQLPRNAGDSIG